MAFSRRRCHSFLKNATLIPRANKTEAIPRSQFIYLSRLHRSEIFSEIIERLVSGESVRSVAHWCRIRELDRTYLNLTETTWRAYIEPLAPLVKEKVASFKSGRTLHPRPYDVQRQISGRIAKWHTRETARIAKWQERETARHLQAEDVLKLRYVLLEGQVLDLMEVETARRVILPECRKLIVELNKIVRQLINHEMARRSISRAADSLK